MAGERREGRRTNVMYVVERELCESVCEEALCENGEGRVWLWIYRRLCLCESGVS